MSQFQEGSRTRTQETKYVLMYIQDGIFQCFFKAMDVMDINVAKVTVENRLEFFAKESYPCLFDITQVKETTKEARDFMANEGNDLVLASAMVVNSPMLKMMANFYIMVNKPKNPTRLFTDRESALEWLKQFKSNI
ncbi:DUF7793 family protein [Adhaeribacter radiodurans]|uniref:DUF7793 domain-containing protein n=1 Tax=Adhaeribacter radiodurans TaxID=2745197 RepID=A0A7L7L699_9BACT|nr:hypothetical protein [Adhaeribacter radiodurans]QMU28303.1 hypothetical protein HUW48_09770 [Adhaeribacter radiodurans]